jgi:DNA-binding response OmpR family regulator
MSLKRRGNDKSLLQGTGIAHSWNWRSALAIILLVEDDRTSRRSIAAFLRLTGYEVYEAEDGEIALNLLASMQVDVVISDLNLPGKLNGIDILGALNALPRKIDAILITGTGSDDVRKRAKSLGAAYMEKPVQLQELEQTIQQRARRAPG